MLLFFVGCGAVVIDSGLFHRVLIFIQDVGHPAVFVVGAEPEGVDAIGPVLDAGHAGAIVIRHVALKCGFPTIAAPIDAEQKTAALVANHVIFVIRAKARATGNDAEIVFERNGHLAEIGACAAPHPHVVEAELQVEARMRLHHQE